MPPDHHVVDSDGLARSLMSAQSHIASVTSGIASSWPHRPASFAVENPPMPVIYGLPNHEHSGRKVSDEFTVPLCREHHQELYRGGNESRWWKHAGIDAIAIAVGICGRNAIQWPVGDP